MAAELGIYLSEQLERLPEDHPDRSFLEGTLQITQSYLDVKVGATESHFLESLPKMDLELLGNELRTKRGELGITQVELAEKVGVNKATIYNWERGDPKTGRPVRPRRDTLELTMHSLSLTPEETVYILALAGYPPSRDK